MVNATLSELAQSLLALQLELYGKKDQELYFYCGQNARHRAGFL